MNMQTRKRVSEKADHDWKLWSIRLKYLMFPIHRSFRFKDNLEQKAISSYTLITS